MIPLREYAVKMELSPVDSHNWGQCLLHGWLQVRHNQKSDEPEYPIHVRIRREETSSEKEKWTWFAANWTMVGLSEGWVVNSPSRAWGQGCRICVSTAARHLFLTRHFYMILHNFMLFMRNFFFFLQATKKHKLGGVICQLDGITTFRRHTKLIKLYKIYAEIITVSPQHYH